MYKEIHYHSFFLFAHALFVQNLKDHSRLLCWEQTLDKSALAFLVRLMIPELNVSENNQG